MIRVVPSATPRPCHITHSNISFRVTPMFNFNFYGSLLHNHYTMESMTTFIFPTQRESKTMKFAAIAGLLTSLVTQPVDAFVPVRNNHHHYQPIRSTTEETETAEASSAPSDDGVVKDPLLIRAARGEKTERTPVWMMRQAGRHIQEYRELCKEYPTFRQRSEIPEVAVEVSLQPWRNYGTDGCILFSDILTPLPGMGIEFTIDEKVGPLTEPMRNWEAIEKVNCRPSCGMVCCVCVCGLFLSKS